MDMPKRVSEMVEISWKVAHCADTKRDWEWRWNTLFSTLNGMRTGVNYFGGLDDEEWEEFLDCHATLREIAFAHYLRGWKE